MAIHKSTVLFASENILDIYNWLLDKHCKNKDDKELAEKIKDFDVIFQMLDEVKEEIDNGGIIN